MLVVRKGVATNDIALHLWAWVGDRVRGPQIPAMLAACTGESYLWSALGATGPGTICLSSPLLGTLALTLQLCFYLSLPNLCPVTQALYQESEKACLMFGVPGPDSVPSIKSSLFVDCLSLRGLDSTEKTCCEFLFWVCLCGLGYSHKWEADSDLFFSKISNKNKSLPLNYSTLC